MVSILAIYDIVKFDIQEIAPVLNLIGISS